MRVLKEDTLALMIDFQERLMPHMQNKEDIKHNTQILIKGLTTLDIPILTTEQYRKGLGETITEFSGLLTNLDHNLYEKKTFSCCDESPILERIKESGKRFIIVFGIESHICVQQTVIDLIENDFIPVVIRDCVSSRKTSDLEIAIKRMEKEGAIISTYESILFELCRISGTDTFKSISKLIK